MSYAWKVVPIDSTADTLVHHGIKGQKWGRRRFQNEDGTLTAAGKKRYSDPIPQQGKKINYRNLKSSAAKQFVADHPQQVGLAIQTRSGITNAVNEGLRDSSMRKFIPLGAQTLGTMTESARQKSYDNARQAVLSASQAYTQGISDGVSDEELAKLQENLKEATMKWQHTGDCVSRAHDEGLISDDEYYEYVSQNGIHALEKDIWSSADNELTNREKEDDKRKENIKKSVTNTGNTIQAFSSRAPESSKQASPASTGSPTANVSSSLSASTQKVASVMASAVASVASKAVEKGKEAYEKVRGQAVSALSSAAEAGKSWLSKVLKRGK